MTRKKAEKRSLWEFPWAYKESFIFVSGITLTGYMLQFLLGSVKAPVFPGNLIVLMVFMALICLIHFTGKNSQIVRWMRSVPLSISVISMLLLQSMIMGIVPQSNTSNHSPHDVLGLSDVMSSWPFLLIIFILLFNLGLTTLYKCFPFKKGNIAFFANHLGLWIVLAAGLAGSGDVRHYKMDLEEGQTEWIAKDGLNSIEMPFAIQLNDFEMEEYDPKITIANTLTNDIETKKNNAMRQIKEGEKFTIGSFTVTISKYYPEARSVLDRYEPVNDYGAAPAALVRCTSENLDTTAWLSCGSFASFPSLIRINDSIALVMMEPEPRSFRSHVMIYTPDEKPETAVIEVNKPAEIKGWKVYQVSYNQEMGKYSNQSTVELIKDPWLPVVYTGIFLMMAGAILLIFRGAKNNSAGQGEVLK